MHAIITLGLSLLFVSIIYGSFEQWLKAVINNQPFALIFIFCVGLYQSVVFIARKVFKMNKKLHDTDIRFEKKQAHLVRIETRLDHHDENFRTLEKRFDRVDDRIDKLEATMNDRFDKVDDRFSKVDERFSKVDERFEKLEATMNDRFAKVDERFEKLEAKVDERFEKLEAKFDAKFEIQDNVNRQMLAMLQNIDHAVNGAKQKLQAS
jgi:chromosome segregation ATPase